MAYILLFLYSYRHIITTEHFTKSFSLANSVMPLNEVNNTRNLHLYLPPEICVANGLTIELYNRQVCLESSRYIVQWIGKYGRQYERKYELVCTDSLVGEEFPLTFNILDTNLEILATAKTIVKFVSSNIKTDQLIVPIGDSLTNNKPWLNRVKNLSLNKIMFRGTRGTSDPTLINGITHEGRSGANTRWYNHATSTYTFDKRGLSTLESSGVLNGFTDSNNNPIHPVSANPFWNKKKQAFDFDFYCNSKADGGAGYFQDNNGNEISIIPTGVQVFLGSNGLNMDPTRACNDICTLVDNVRNSKKGGSIPIFVVNTLFRAVQSLSGEHKYITDVMVQNLEMALFESLRRYKNVFFIPIAVTHDSEFNYRFLEVPVNPHLSSIKARKIVDSVHPGPAGYAQMADIIFSTIAAHYK